MLAVAMSMMLGSCSDNEDMPVNPPQPAHEIPDVVKNLPGTEVWEMPVDYSDPYNWALLPTTADKPYDVFYLQPTSWSMAEGETSYVASMDNAEMRTVGLVWSTLSGQGVFSEYCNVYAPYYRQADAGYIAGLSWEDAHTFWAYEASKDATQALDYYFEHYNKGKPFFLAGHSQGAAVVEALLADYFRLHPAYYSRMIAAYPIGYAVTTDYLAKNPHLKFAERADDTGVIVSYNTEGAENHSQRNIVVAPSGSLSINPINWKRDDTHADVKANLGSLTVEGKLVTPGLADARVDTVRGSVVVTTIADPKLYAIPAEESEMFGPECYHIHDYGFSFNNLKQNVADRIKAFTEKK